MTYFDMYRFDDVHCNNQIQIMLQGKAYVWCFKKLFKIEFMSSFP